MKIKRYAMLCCLSLALVQQAQATLGQGASSVTADRKAFSAVKRDTRSINGYTVQEMESEASVVREYVSADGVVFAIAWDGLIHPDLTPLLGSYGPEYRSALRQNPRKQGRRRHQVKTERVVVEKWGHMRHLQGRAYVPDLIPSGVSIDEIR